jgi:hypothetical protein
MTPVTRQTASIHIANHTSRYDYLNAARKNIATDDNKQQDYDQECFDGGDDSRISTSTRTTRNSKLKQQQQQQQQQTATMTRKSKTVAFANQNQKQEPAQASSAQEQQNEQKPKGKMLSKRQAKKYDAQIEEDEEAASILASIAAAAASASKKERTPPYWTRQHEKAKAGARLQKAMSSVLQSDFECEFV